MSNDGTGDKLDKETNSADASFSEPPQEEEEAKSDLKGPGFGQCMTFWKVVDEHLKKLVTKFGTNTGSTKWKEYV